MRKTTTKLRLFVAAYPPEPCARAMLAALDALDLPSSRRVPAEQVHLTLHFIGDVDPREVDRVTESVARSAAGLPPCTLTPVGLVALPRRGRVRLIAMETDVPATLLELHRRLVMRLARSPRSRPGDRFLPHLTLCRFTPQVPRSRVALTGAFDLPPMSLERVHLMRSTLSHQGATHTELAAWALDGPR